jgi:hypothetical protein
VDDDVEYEEEETILGYGSATSDVQPEADGCPVFWIPTGHGWQEKRLMPRRRPFGFVKGDQ